MYELGSAPPQWVYLPACHLREDDFVLPWEACGRGGVERRVGGEALRGVWEERRWEACGRRVGGEALGGNAG